MPPIHCEIIYLCLFSPSKIICMSAPLLESRETLRKVGVGAPSRVKIRSRFPPTSIAAVCGCCSLVFMTAGPSLRGGKNQKASISDVYRQCEFQSEVTETAIVGGKL